MAQRADEDPALLEREYRKTRSFHYLMTKSPARWIGSCVQRGRWRLVQHTRESRHENVMDEVACSDGAAGSSHSRASVARRVKPSVETRGSRRPLLPAT